MLVASVNHAAQLCGVAASTVASDIPSDLAATMQLIASLWLQP